MPLFKIDHIGYDFKYFKKAINLFRHLGYVFDDDKIDQLRNVLSNYAMFVSVLDCLFGESVELVSPIDNSKSPIDGFKKKSGPISYHLWFSVKNINEQPELLRNLGVILVEKTDKSVPLGGIVCFLFHPDLGLVELIQY